MGGGGISREAAAIPRTQASLPGPGRRAESRCVFGKGFPSRAKSEPRDQASHISPAVSASSPLPVPPLIFFFPLSFNLISSNSTFVVNRRHAETSQSSPRNQLVKKTGPALGKQATGAAPTPARPLPLPAAPGAQRGAWHPGLPAEPRRGSTLRPGDRRPGRRPRPTLPLQAAVVVCLSLPSAEEGLRGRREPEGGRTPDSNGRAYGLGLRFGGSHCARSQAASPPRQRAAARVAASWVAGPFGLSPGAQPSPSSQNGLAAVVIPLVSWEK